MRMPPRQKMINMMYLVLTAILALNVSKEVLDAFAIMDADLVRGQRAAESRSQVEYSEFADAAERFPEKYEMKHMEATRVKAQADRLVKHIEDIKAQAVAEADGLEMARLRGTDADGTDTLRALLALDAKDDRETLTRMMVGSEPARPKRDPGGAYDLKQRISAFRDSLKILVGSREPELTAALDMLFDFRDRRDASGTLNNWESTNFYDVPLAAGIASLSKLQADIRSAENDMVKWLYRSVTREEYVSGALASAVIPQSTLVMAGDSFRADVFLAAYDPKNRPTVTVNGAGVLPLGADGKAKLRLRGDQVGEHKVQGMIHFEGPKGTEEFSYEVSYQVMAPLLVASPTKMNVLYRGVENPIEISVPGAPAEKVQATISTGRISRSGNGWVATGMTASTAEVNASVPMPDGTMRRIGPVKFRVKDLPPPTAFVAGKSARESKVRKAEMTAARGVIAKLEDTDFDAPWQVQRFRLMVVRKGGTPVEHSTTGNAFSAAMDEVLDACRPGDLVYIDEIKARLANGQGPVRDLTPIALRVMP